MERLVIFFFERKFFCDWTAREINYVAIEVLATFCRSTGTRRIKDKDLDSDLTQLEKGVGH